MFKTLTAPSKLRGEYLKAKTTTSWETEISQVRYRSQDKQVRLGTHGRVLEADRLGFLVVSVVWAGKPQGS